MIAPYLDFHMALSILLRHNKTTMPKIIDKKELETIIQAVRGFRQGASIEDLRAVLEPPPRGVRCNVAYPDSLPRIACYPSAMVPRGAIVCHPPPPIRGSALPSVVHRLLIDLSWNSSRLEGNTYSLLETEQLLAFGRSAEGKDLREAQMILNHKAAIELLMESSACMNCAALHCCGMPLSGPMHALARDIPPCANRWESQILFACATGNCCTMPLQKSFEAAWTGRLR